MFTIRMLSIEINGVKSEDTFEIITNKGMKGSPLKKPFEEMYKIALVFGEILNNQIIK